MIDSRGKLLGRLNLVDAAVAAFVIVLVPMSYVAYRVFRIPPPEILSVTPRTLTPETPRRVRLTGKHFRPYLGAFIAKTGEPYSLNGRLPMDAMQGTFLIVTPDEVELALPTAADAGTYDIHLYDEAQEVASFQAAFTLAPLPRVTVEAVVRFVVPPETAPFVKEGDRDRWEQAGASVLTPGELATMGPVRPVKDAVTFITLHAHMPGAAFDATVRIPAKTRGLGGWEYKGEWLRAGETLLFETERYRIYGVIERVSELPAAASAAAAGGGK
ncbi:MAG: hypothetical protein HY048_16005 [Acidobacteria bacterium]|nr:hypothetical protein [Acidobacteriota bacterium]